MGETWPVVHAGGNQIECLVAHLQVVHCEHMFPSMPDGSHGAGCYPDARLAAIV
jgi:hypothetical protein